MAGRRVLRATPLLALLVAAAPPGDDHAPGDYAGDARALDTVIAANYAYLERFGGTVPTSPKLVAERDAVHDADGLLHYAEDKIAALADHHAITGSSFRNSWGLVPSRTDLWIVADGPGYRIESVKTGGPAAKAGVMAGDILVAVGGLPIDEAVAGYWRDLGFETVTDTERRAFAARVLAAGRRDRPRALTIRHGADVRALDLPNLYAASPGEPAPVTSSKTAGGAIAIRFNDSLGNSETIAAFDAAMAKVPAGARLILDLTDTGSGGDSLIARAVMGWFVDKPRFYQMHRLVAEERETGVVRQWVEQVLPPRGQAFLRQGRSPRRPLDGQHGRGHGRRLHGDRRPGLRRRHGRAARRRL